MAWTANDSPQRRGINVVFDPVGGTLTETALRATAWRGRLVIVGFASGGGFMGTLGTTPRDAYLSRVEACPRFR